MHMFDAQKFLIEYAAAKSTHGHEIYIFTITTEIHARSLANFYCQYTDRHKIKIHAMCQRGRAGNSTICTRHLCKVEFIFSIFTIYMYIFRPCLYRLK